MADAILPSHKPCRPVTVFSKVHKIGEGTYGDVYLARDRESSQLVALKRVKLSSSGFDREGMPLTSVREVSLLRRLSHPNIVTLAEVVVGSKADSLFLVFEYCEYELAKLLDSMPTPFSLPEAKCLSEQLLCAVQHLHGCGVLHRDLKMSNLLLNAKGERALSLSPRSLPPPPPSLPPPASLCRRLPPRPTTALPPIRLPLPLPRLARLTPSPLGPSPIRQASSSSATLGSRERRRRQAPSRLASSRSGSRRTGCPCTPGCPSTPAPLSTPLLARPPGTARRSSSSARSTTARPSTSGPSGASSASCCCTGRSCPARPFT